MIDKKYKGKEFAPFCFLIERNKIGEFARSIGSNNPIYFDKEAAIANGFTNIPTPPTFGVAINAWGFPELTGQLEEIGIDFNKLIPVEQEFEYYTPIYAGDEIKVFIKIEMIKNSKLMDFVTISARYERDGELVLVSELSVISKKQV